MRVSRIFLIPAAVSVAMLSGSAFAQTQTWYLDPNHSSAQFSVRHMGISTVRGAFTKVNGTIHEVAGDPSKDTVDVVIDTASVDTRVTMRDNDLRSPHFFDAAMYPTMTFKSTSVEAAGPGKLKVTGNLTIRGITKPVVLDVDGPTPPFKDPRGITHRGVSATSMVDRTDFGMTYLPQIVANPIQIQIDAEMVDQKPGPPPPSKPGPAPAQ